jgi:hypothetical protein
VTAVIDRLVHAGYVERCADRRDRRKVLVRAPHENIEAMKYMSMQERMFTLWSTFDVQDLEVIADFLSRSTELAVTCCKEISQESPPSPKRRRGGACAAPVKRRKLRKRRQDGNRYCRPISQMRRHAPISRLVLQGEI